MRSPQPSRPMSCRSSGSLSGSHSSEMYSRFQGELSLAACRRCASRRSKLICCRQVRPSSSGPWLEKRVMLPWISLPTRVSAPPPPLLPIPYEEKSCEKRPVMCGSLAAASSMSLTRERLVELPHSAQSSIWVGFSPPPLSTTRSRPRARSISMTSCGVQPLLRASGWSMLKKTRDWIALSRISLMPCAAVNSGAITLESMSNDGGLETRSLVRSRRSLDGRAVVAGCVGCVACDAERPPALRRDGCSALTVRYVAGGGSSLCPCSWRRR
mmetsp:Transcript_48609/g.153974  ORF Transcript_48609/g.153974 Transcript_48609/m.153974 type:complete len:270 (+) Transcript_48609:116-925(+)